MRGLKSSQRKVLNRCSRALGNSFYSSGIDEDLTCMARANILRGVASAAVLALYDKFQGLMFGKVRISSQSAKIYLKRTSSGL
jgi:hypothetical protein